MADKHELLFARGINFNELPAWHKRGVGLWWEQYEKIGHNPKTKERAVAIRRRLREDMELPFGAEYEALVRERVTEATAATSDG